MTRAPSFAGFEEPTAAESESWKRAAAAIVGIALVCLLATVGNSVLTGIPRPGMADEFSYLLSADTFARLRLSNPPHKLWEFFEAFFVLQQPTYSSKYPPGQGLVLAMGQWLGHPVIGVWLNSTLMSAAVVWMLWGWLPRRWAIFGGVLAVLGFGISGAWAQSYQAGSLMATGSALLYGGLRRVIRASRTRDAVWLSVGLLVLANSRPYEGLVISLPAAAVLAVWLLRQRGASMRSAVTAIVAPILLVLALGATWMAMHNRAVTGNALKLPYQAQHEAYPIVSLFVWQKAPVDTEYNHWFFKVHEGKHRYNLMQGNPPGIRWRTNKRRFIWFRQQYLPGLSWLPLLLLPLALRNRWTLLALGACLFLFAGQILTVPIMPHYSAAVMPLLIVLIVQSVRALGGLRRTRPLVPLVAALLVLIFAGNTVANARLDNRARWEKLHRRQEVQKSLEATDGEHLVVVEYGPEHNPDHHWVYNSAEINSQKVIWANHMGEWRNQELRSYFKNRRMWRLKLGFGEGATTVPPLEPYTRPGPRVMGAATTSRDLFLALERLRKSRDPELREGLREALRSEAIPGTELEGSALALAFGTTRDRWTRDARPAAIIFSGRGPTASTPVVRLACYASRDELPVTVSVDDGQTIHRVSFRRRGQRSVALSKVEPGNDVLVVVSANKGWHGRKTERRSLGVNLVRVDLEPSPPEG